MTSFDQFCHLGLSKIREQSLYRSLKPLTNSLGVEVHRDGRSLIAFASNDYLGLADHPDVKAAAERAAREWGAGTGASRLITGNTEGHESLEIDLAEFKEAEAALSFATGYQTAVGTLNAILSENDIVLSDQLNHACLIDGMRLAKAQIRVFQHNDLDHLKSLLEKAAHEKSGSHADSEGNLLIVTESVFSMDGDCAPLPEIVALKEQFGAWLFVDEAHATGLYGPTRSGRARETETSGQIEVQMGTLGKALGSAGGFVCGSQAFRNWLINSARSFIFSTAPCPAAVAAARAAIEIVRGKEGSNLNQHLWNRIHQFANAYPLAQQPESPIIPIIIGNEDHCLRVAQELETAGFFVPAIRYPSVAKGQARLRLTVSARHTEAQIDQLAQTLIRLVPQ